MKQARPDLALHKDNSPTNAEAVNRRRGGRTERNRLAVAAAVLELIAERGLDFEIQEVAGRSGVHRTTIFRRWPDRTALIAEAMLEHAGSVHVDVTADWRADMHVAAIKMRDYFSNPVEFAINRMLAATNSDAVLKQMADFYAPVLEEFAKPIVAAQQRGEIAADIEADLVAQMMISTMIVSTMFTRSPLDDEIVAAVAAHVIRACGG